ncbi:MAG: 50S ribosomal protein L9 [Bacillota bacterium]|jgi:large subunit ribosomal protein L9
MKVILLEDIKSLGKRGDVKVVSDGYARNFLLPKKLVVEADKSTMNMLEHEKEVQAKKEAEILAKAKDVANKLKEQGFSIKAKCGEGGRLFGSITNADVAEELAKSGIEVDKRKIEISEPIKSLGDYQVVLRLHPKVQSKIMIKIEAVEN